MYIMQNNEPVQSKRTSWTPKRKFYTVYLAKPVDLSPDTFSRTMESCDPPSNHNLHNEIQKQGEHASQPNVNNNNARTPETLISLD